jgi:tetratricopeptide (TPR) repeat protein
MAKPISPKKNYTKYYSWVLFALAFLLYSNTIQHEYAYDDYSLIVDNQLVKQGVSGIPDILKTNYRYGYWNDKGTLYRPASLVMFAVEWEFWPNQTSAGHFVNVILYALLCMILYKVLLLLFKDYKFYIPLVATLVFILHPIHTEVVANIKSRDEILAMLFGLLQIFYFVKYWDQGRKVKDIILSLIFFALALLSKESAILFSLFLIFGVLLFRKIDIKTNWKLSVPFLLVFGVYLLIRASVLGGLSAVNNVGVIDNFLVETDGFISLFANAFHILGVYLFKLVLPYQLISDGSINHFELVQPSSWKFLCSLLVYMIIFFFSIRFYRKNALMSFAGIVFLSSIFFISNLFFLTGTSYGERLLFVPSLGFAIAIAYLFSLLADKLKNQTYVNVFLAILFVFYGYQTIDRNKDWESNKTLYEADIQKAPNSARLNTILAMEYIKTANSGKAGSNASILYNKSEGLLLRAIHIYPDYFDAYERLAMVYYQKKDADKAIEFYHKALELNPNFANAYSNLGVIYFERKEYLNAIDVYTKAVELNPRFADGHQNLASAYGSLAQQISVTNMRKAEMYLAKAVHHFQISLKLKPNNEVVKRLLQMSQQQYSQAKAINAQQSSN